MGQKDTVRQKDDGAPRPARDNTVRVAVISAIGTVFTAALTAAGSFMSGLVTYTGPGAAPLVPPSATTVSAPPDNESGTGRGGGRNGPAAGSVSLTDLKSVTGSNDISAGPRRVNASAYPDTLYQYVNCATKRSSIYQLDRRYSYFNATIGPSDDSRSGYTVFFTVLVDDREVLNERVAVGESRSIQADVSGGYRMTISVISDRPAGRCPNGDLIAVWAGPTLKSSS